MMDELRVEDVSVRFGLWVSCWIAVYEVFSWGGGRGRAGQGRAGRVYIRRMMKE
jgi:hypothetical protein